MNRLWLSLILAAPILASAAPSSQVAWTAEQLNFVKGGNAHKGRELAANCTACHGEIGISSIPDYPSLTGQLPTYLFKQLQDYADGSRDNPLMAGIAKGLSKQDMADLSAWFASLPPPPAPYGKETLKRAEALVKQGENERLLVPCEVCHGNNGEGQKLDIPALAGQQAEYLKATLNAFKDGSRHNDVYGKMRLIAKTLSEKEIEELAVYYQSLK
ncbi:c-type cytochrome [Candidatus Methylomicrobium oryzae]|jgi:cytochrome c553|uniref:c-type cytochrome n=1 Tax=Candidatus Methylomicrobium oryzae TaxID=2802053 RepID=UPI001923B8ED|nr:c-type cytochrome [Methylomicrobium sp. RS1]MBL1264099.1 cytochrome c4 [Methylomicrobium sp. RS1]